MMARTARDVFEEKRARGYSLERIRHFAVAIESDELRALVEDEMAKTKDAPLTKNECGVYESGQPAVEEYEYRFGAKAHRNEATVEMAWHPEFECWLWEIGSYSLGEGGGGTPLTDTSPTAETKVEAQRQALEALRERIDGIRNEKHRASAIRSLEKHLAELPQPAESAPTKARKIDIVGGSQTPVNRIRVDRIEPSPLNRKIEDDAESVQRLAASMDERGLVQPIVVRPLDFEKANLESDDDRFEIVVGERRWRAARRLGWERIDAIIRLMDADEAHADRLVENLQREDVPPLEQSEGVMYLLERYGNDAQEVATRLGVTPGWVYVRARLQNLSPAWREALAAADTEHERIRDHVTFQEEIAKLPAGTQDLLLDDPRVDACRTATALRDLIGELCHRVADAPWPAECEKKLPAKHRCAKCEKRSDAQGQKALFADGFGSDRNPYCLDPACWRRKEVAWITGEIEQARKQHGCAVLLSTSYVGEAQARRLAQDFGGEVLSGWQYTLDEDADGKDLTDHQQHTGVIVHGERKGETVKVHIPTHFLYEDDEGEAEESDEERQKREEQVRKVQAERAAARARAEEARLYIRALEKAIWVDDDDGDPDFDQDPLLEPPGNVALLHLCILIDPRFDDYDYVKNTDAHEEAVAHHVWVCLCRTVCLLNEYVMVTEEENKVLDIAELMGGADLRQQVEQKVAEMKEALSDAD